MTDRECFLYASAFAQYLLENSSTHTVAIAGDHRSSTPRILAAVARGLGENNFDVDYCGMIPTPALAGYAFDRGYGSIMVTGSHIPDDRNGIKFYLPGGEILKPDEQAISARYQELKSTLYSDRLFSPEGELGDVPELPAPNTTPVDEYVRRYVDFFPGRCLAGRTIVVYQHSAVIREIYGAILEKLGADVVEVGWSDSFVPVDTEAVDEPERLARWVAEHDADALISADGDSDRPLLVDENGNVVRGDVLGIIASGYLGADGVATPVSCNTALEKCGLFQTIVRTRIGSPYVIAGMQDAADQGARAIVGYEANGGYLTATDLTHRQSGDVLPALPTRDCTLPILAALAEAGEQGKTLGGVVDDLPARYTCSSLLRPLPNPLGHAIVRYFEGDNRAAEQFGDAFGIVTGVDRTDGVRITFEDQRVVHLRPSGNAPEFRCYSEAETAEAAEDVNREALALIAGPIRDAVEAHVAGENIGANLVRMRNPEAGMDVVIVSTVSEHQAAYWQERLDATRGQVAASDAVILVVHEDWPGGAGNGLGTLYAIHKAAALAVEKDNLDLLKMLNAGAAVGLYHTAGKGTRLAPLPASENNNKPGVDLPGRVTVGDSSMPLTILEAVIQQTAIYADSRRGRVSVFWGDQVFVPSRPADYSPTHHGDILAQLGPMPDARTWAAKGLDKYGLIAVDARGNAAQVEKVSHATATELIESGVIGVETGIGVSLGSFSMSAVLTDELLAEFADMLAAREGKLDSDPHFWMPLTLDGSTYVSVMTGKGTDEADARAHYTRMGALKGRLLERDPSQGVFGVVDAGASGYWWDYGQLHFYIVNNLKLSGSDAESAAMRRFYRLDDSRAGSSLGDTNVDDGSIVLDSSIGSGRIVNSVVIGCVAGDVDIENSVVVGSAATSMTVHDGLIYHAASDGDIALAPGGVRADVYPSPDEQLVLHTTTDRDGGVDWNDTLPDNPASYAELHARNQHVDTRQASDNLAARIREVSASVRQR
jgi:phosphomannomutase